MYFLVMAEEIIYVGASDYPSKRVWTHAGCKRKDFDYEVYLSVPPPDDLTEAERYWIRTVCPKHNKAFNPCPNPEAEGWGKDPDYFMLRLPASTGMLLRMIQAATARTLTVEVQIAVERRAQALGLKITPKFNPDCDGSKGRPT